MKNTRRHEEAMAKKPRTTITAIAQCGKSLEWSDWRLPVPPVDDAPAAVVEAAVDVVEADAREADDADAREADAADEEDMLAKMESGKVV
jgi:hypothetical protein